MIMKETDLSAFNVVEVDIDQDPLSTAQAGVRSVPTLIITKEGQELKRTTGQKTQEQLKEFLCLE